ncbi:hypothetical protein HYX02_05890 [Candidatus Woesearchaeota archaeon]|nr:hypothetical protein [Candidatus Woesearchaeota archaeon]
MAVEDALKKALSDASVLNSVRTIFKDIDSKGFLIHVANDGTVTYGSPIHYEPSRIASRYHSLVYEAMRGMFANPEKELTSNPELRLLALLAEKIRPDTFFEFCKYLWAYESGNNKRVDKSGTLFLSKWLPPLVTEVLVEYVTEFFGGKPVLEHMLEGANPLRNYLVLNELTGYHPNAVLIQGELRQRDGNHVGIYGVKQEAPKMEPEEVAVVSTLDSLSQFFNVDILKKPELYKRFNGILDLGRGVLHLDSDIEKRINGIP